MFKEGKFSKWVKWQDRDILLKDELQHPGVYAIRISNKVISNKPFSLRKEIEYIGMTRKSLKSRLSSFNRGLQGKRGHSGASRMMRHKKGLNEKATNIYVAVQEFPLPKTNDPHINIRKTAKGLEILGKIVQYEYLCFSAFVSKFDRLPDFNDLGIYGGKNKSKR